jgi:hypothetical protein
LHAWCADRQQQTLARVTRVCAAPQARPGQARTGQSSTGQVTGYRLQGAGCRKQDARRRSGDCRTACRAHTHLHARAAADRRRWRAAARQAAASAWAFGPGHPGEGTWQLVQWTLVDDWRLVVGGWRLAGVEAWVTGVECVRGGGRPTTWCCHAVMNRWNTTERVHATSVASRRTLGAVAVAVAARSVVWWCGRSSGAGEVSQILAARFEAAAGQQWAVQTASRERASGESQANRRGQQDRRAACGGRRATGSRPTLVLDAEAEAEADADAAGRVRVWVWVVLLALAGQGRVAGLRAAGEELSRRRGPEE